MDTKGIRISLHLIVKRHLPPEAEKWSHEKIMDALSKVTHVRLDRENIGQMDLELLGNSVTNLYLQQNRVERIENLDCVKNLQFLTLSSNQLRELEGLSCLRKLIFLDLSFNFIHKFDADRLPESLAILNMKDNKCTEDHTYRERAIQCLPRLQQLDEQEVTDEERRAAGLDVSSDSESEEDAGDRVQDDMYAHLEEEMGNPDSFASQSAAMLLRSQDRVEDYLVEHKNKLDYLEDLRVESAKTMSH